MSQANRPSAFLACTLSAALAALALPGAAVAGTAITSSTDNCNGALPGYEGALRKRPLGIINEGTGNAFVSCGTSVDEGGNLGNINAVVYLINRGTTAQAVTCTFVDGLPPEYNAVQPTLPIATYRTKAVAVLPGALGFANWTPGEFGLENFSAYGSFSCALPPKMEISIAGVAWEESAP